MTEQKTQKIIQGGNYLKKDRFSKSACAAIEATARFLQVSENSVAKNAIEDRNELFEEVLGQRTGGGELSMLTVSEKVFRLYGKKASAVFSFGKDSDRGAIHICFLAELGRAVDFAKADKYLDGIDLPDGISVLYGGYEGEKCEDVSLELRAEAESEEEVLHTIGRMHGLLKEAEPILRPYTDHFEDYNR